ncbi:MAG TPA: hypothetical protein VJ904_00745 [Tichowtungia sp.]|nr:hypothetical protein [Tichowtungia sp.]
MSDHLHIFVDEAGDPTLFGKKRGSDTIVGNEGCSQYFIMGKLEVHDPVAVSTALHELHKLSGANPWFFRGLEKSSSGRKVRSFHFPRSGSFCLVARSGFGLWRSTTGRFSADAAAAFFAGVYSQIGVILFSGMICSSQKTVERLCNNRSKRRPIFCVSRYRFVGIQIANHHHILILLTKRAVLFHQKITKHGLTDLQAKCYITRINHLQNFRRIGLRPKLTACPKWVWKDEVILCR